MSPDLGAKSLAVKSTPLFNLSPERLVRALANVINLTNEEILGVSCVSLLPFLW